MVDPMLMSKLHLFKRDFLQQWGEVFKNYFNFSVIMFDFNIHV